MKNVFIDSNIWLSLYHFTNDNLDKFSQLSTKYGDTLRILIPEQVRDEVLRNRDAKIKDALNSFGLHLCKYPVFCQHYQEYEVLREQAEDIKRKHDDWLIKINEDVCNRCLPADTTLRRFMNPKHLLTCTEEDIKAAERRLRMGNPPGKDKKLGDAINWECLLRTVPKGEDLFLVSADQDYCSVLDKNQFNAFLNDEWESRKESKIHYYSSLSSFLTTHAQDIALEEERKKDVLVLGLFLSGSFKETHNIVRELNQIDDWNESQVDSLCSAALRNNQVLWILDDEDIQSFYRGLVNNENYNTADIASIREMVCDKAPNDESIPF